MTSIDGSMRLEDRVECEREFRDNAQVMVATEAAGEGINLQFCAVMVIMTCLGTPPVWSSAWGRFIVTVSAMK